ncbi:hypothetical protein AWN90_02650 [Nocardia terpenica]|uniref:MFS transporter n=2 Tax=Nocardia terpenica TaxID=455432 RepID=A0A164KQY1_9NOCA|nr:hypothetical protein AWN90_02650 [Nocardia terpenica]
MVATVGTRLAVCTVPLGAVFAARDHVSSYAWGAIIAGAYAAGEAIGAPTMGARFQRHSLRRELAWVAVAEAVALVGVITCLAIELPLAAAPLAAVAGGIASGTPGGLRTLAMNSAESTARESALALDSIVSQACQLAGPALAALLAVTWTPDAPLLIVSGGLLIVAVSAVKLPHTLVATGGDTGTTHPAAPAMSTLTVIRKIWPSMATVTVMLMITSVLDVTLPGILEQRDASRAWAGVALSGLAATSIAGSFVYGLRRWPGRPHQHTLGLATIFAAIVVLAGLVSLPLLTVALVVIAGLFEAPASTARGLAVSDDLPTDAWPVGFSLLYSCGGIGYALASALSAVFLVATNAVTTLTILAVAGFSVVLATGWAEHLIYRTRGRTAPTKEPATVQNITE